MGLLDFLKPKRELVAVDPHLGNPDSGWTQNAYSIVTEKVTGRPVTGPKRTEPSAAAAARGKPETTIANINDSSRLSDKLFDTAVKFELPPTIQNMLIARMNAAQKKQYDRMVPTNGKELVTPNGNGLTPEQMAILISNILPAAEEEMLYDLATPIQQKNYDRLKLTPAAVPAPALIAPPVVEPPASAPAEASVGIPEQPANDAAPEQPAIPGNNVFAAAFEGSPDTGIPAAAVSAETVLAETTADVGDVPVAPVMAVDIELPDITPVSHVPLTDAEFARLKAGGLSTHEEDALLARATTEEFDEWTNSAGAADAPQNQITDETPATVWSEVLAEAQNTDPTAPTAPDAPPVNNTAEPDISDTYQKLLTFVDGVVSGDTNEDAALLNVDYMDDAELAALQSIVREMSQDENKWTALAGLSDHINETIGNRSSAQTPPATQDTPAADAGLARRQKLLDLANDIAGRKNLSYGEADLIVRSLTDDELTEFRAIINARLWGNNQHPSLVMIYACAHLKMRNHSLAITMPGTKDDAAITHAKQKLSLPVPQDNDPAHDLPAGRREPGFGLGAEDFPTPAPEPRAAFVPPAWEPKQKNALGGVFRRKAAVFVGGAALGYAFKKACTAAACAAPGGVLVVGGIAVLAGVGTLAIAAAKDKLNGEEVTLKGTLKKHWKSAAMAGAGVVVGANIDDIAHGATKAWDVVSDRASVVKDWWDSWKFSDLWTPAPDADVADGAEPPVFHNPPTASAPAQPAASASAPPRAAVPADERPAPAPKPALAADHNTTRPRIVHKPVSVPPMVNDDPLNRHGLPLQEKLASMGLPANTKVTELNRGILEIVEPSPAVAATDAPTDVKPPPIYTPGGPGDVSTPPAPAAATGSGEVLRMEDLVGDQNVPFTVEGVTDAGSARQAFNVTIDHPRLNGLPPGTRIEINIGSGDGVAANDSGSPQRLVANGTFAPAN